MASIDLVDGAAKRPDRPSVRMQARASKTISIVVPCLNEERVIGEFVAWCREGLRAAGRTGQILIVDSSDDDSPRIARSTRGIRRG